jgi:hypothetical protein
MRTSVFIRVSVLVALAVVLPSNADDSCPYLKSRRGLAGYESGGPYKLEHFHLTKGRTDLRDFLWKHWHNRIRGVAEAKVGTVDAGIVTALYVVQPRFARQMGYRCGTWSSPAATAMLSFPRRLSCSLSNS